MANSAVVIDNVTLATAATYNNLRSDVLDASTGHDHDGTAEHGKKVALLDASDVNPTGLADNDFLQWNAATAKWEPVSTAAAPTALVDLTDVNPVGLTNGDRPGWDAVASEWTMRKSDGVYNVRDYGADPSASAAVNAAAIMAAITAAQSNFGTVYFPPLTYACGTELVVTADVRLLGYGATLLFGATNGIRFDYNYSHSLVEGLTLITNSASGGKALCIGKAGWAAFCTVRDVNIKVTDWLYDRWAYGIWANYWESAGVYNLFMYAAATVGIYLEEYSNALKFYQVSITGGVGTAGPTPIEHAVVIVSASGPTVGVSFFGGTFQGYFAHSGISISDSQVEFYGCHFENTCPAATCTLGDDIYILRGFDCLFSGCFSVEGILLDGECRNITVIGCAMASFNAGTYGNQNNIIGSRFTTLTLSIWLNHNVIGCIDASGNSRPVLLASHSGIKAIIGGGGTSSDFYASAASVLRTTGKLIADAGLGVGNSAAATTLGSVAKKMQVFDAAGTSLGYVAIYDAIT